MSSYVYYSLYNLNKTINNRNLDILKTDFKILNYNLKKNYYEIYLNSEKLLIKSPTFIHNFKGESREINTDSFDINDIKNLIEQQEEYKCLKNFKGDSDNIIDILNKKLKNLDLMANKKKNYIEINFKLDNEIKNYIEKLEKIIKLKFKNRKKNSIFDSNIITCRLNIDDKDLLISKVEFNKLDGTSIKIKSFNEIEKNENYDISFTFSISLIEDEITNNYYLVNNINSMSLNELSNSVDNNDLFFGSFEEDLF